MTPLDELIRDFVTPVLKPAGFKKKGKAFRFTDTAGDSVLIEFGSHAVDERMIVFDAFYCLAPAAVWKWLHRNQEPMRIPDSGSALARAAIVPPRSVAHRPDADQPFRERWAFDAAGRQECGRELARSLAESVLPRALPLLDRSRLLAAMSDTGSPLVFLYPPALSTIFLRIDDASAEEVEAMLPGLAGNPAEKFLTAWVREYLGSRSGGGPQRR